MHAVMFLLLLVVSEMVTIIYSEKFVAGSATSLDSTIVDDNRSYHRVRYYESDIEVLSNPSQSSIEVLSYDPTTTHIR